MTSQCPQGKPRRRPLRLLGYILVAVLLNLALFVATTLALRAYSLARADTRCDAIVAEIQKSDPRWQWEDILADRLPVPETDNAALKVADVIKLLPGAEHWNPMRSPATGSRPSGDNSEGALEPPSSEDARAREALSLARALGEQVPAHRLRPELVKNLRAELDKVRAAREEARQLVRFSTGRFHVTWSKDLISTRVPHLDQMRTVAMLMQLDAALAAEDGDIDRALVSCRAALAAGRSVGDEPILLALWVRCQCRRAAVQGLERALAQGTASPESLASLGQLIAAEDSEPILRRALRGERAAWCDVLGRIYSGELALSDFGSTTKSSLSWKESLLGWTNVRVMARFSQAVLLEVMTRMVDAADLPLAQQRAAYLQLDEEAGFLKVSTPRAALAFVGIPPIVKVTDGYFRSLAELQVARVALAVERFRLTHGMWPARLDQLVPEFLNEVPEDPFGQRAALRLCFVDGGLVIYSVGPTGEDMRGLLDRATDSQDIGFQLWNPAHRRQSPSPEPPP